MLLLEVISGERVRRGVLELGAQRITEMSSGKSVYCQVLNSLLGNLSLNPDLCVYI